jgi:uroporphyrinogen III methyltransferase/synthase
MAVRWATRPDQSVVAAPLSELGNAVAEAGMKPPATIIIGDVVRLREKLSWFEQLPLSGQRIIVTRAAGQAPALTARLRSLGADAAELPVIEIRPASDYSPLDKAIANLPEYGWLIFTSANGVRFFLERLERSGRDLRALPGRICAIGPATSAALAALHIKVDLTPAEYVAESLVEAFANQDLEGKRILLPRAAVARDLIPVELAKRGARVDVVEAYRTEIPEFAHEYAREVLAHKPHWITFTSTSTVNHFLSIAGKAAVKDVKVATIGPVTTQACLDRGVFVDAEASPYTIDGLVEAILLSRRSARDRTG